MDTDSQTDKFSSLKDCSNYTGNEHMLQELNNTVIELPEKKVLREVLTNKDLLREVLGEMSKHVIEELNRACCTAKRKYVRLKDRKYGNLPRGWERKEDIFKFFNSKEHYLRKNGMAKRDWYLLDMFYALRIGEVKHIDIVWNQMLLKINNNKEGRFDYIPIHGKTIKLLERLEHIRNRSAKRVADDFRAITKKEGMNYVYDERAGDGADLNQYSSHTLRHTGFTIFENHVKDPLKGIKYGRWKEDKRYGCAPIYFHYSMEEMRKDLEEAFKDYYCLIEDYDLEE